MPFALLGQAALPRKPRTSGDDGAAHFLVAQLRTIADVGEMRATLSIGRESDMPTTKANTSRTRTYFTASLPWLGDKHAVRLCKQTEQEHRHERSALHVQQVNEVVQQPTPLGQPTTTQTTAPGTQTALALQRAPCKTSSAVPTAPAQRGSCLRRTSFDKVGGGQETVHAGHPLRIFCKGRVPAEHAAPSRAFLLHDWREQEVLVGVAPPRPCPVEGGQLESLLAAEELASVRSTLHAKRAGLNCWLGAWRRSC